MCIMCLFHKFRRFFFGFSLRSKFCCFGYAKILPFPKALHILLLQKIFTSCVCFLFQVRCFNIILSRLSSFASPVAFNTFKINIDSIIPSFGQFKIGCCLFKAFQSLLSSFLFTCCKISEETSWIKLTNTFEFLSSLLHTLFGFLRIHVWALHFYSKII